LIFVGTSDFSACFERLGNATLAARDAKDTKESQWREGEAELG
jgi:hypothetical protein